MRLAALSALLTLAVFGAANAHAADTVTFTLLDPVKTVPASGGRVSFTASVAAPITNNGDAFLNGLGFNIYPGNAFSTDETDFFDTYPLSLAPGESFTGSLFAVIVPAGTVAGPYSGLVSLIGGATDGSQDVLATQSFAITATPTAAVPEPASWAVLTLGIGAVGYAMRRRRFVIDGAAVA